MTPRSILDRGGTISEKYAPWALLRNWFKPGGFLSQLVTLIFGTSVSYLVTIVTAPLLSRIFTPEQFGHFAAYLSTASVLLIFATGRYEVTILLPKEEEEARSLVRLTVSLCLGFSLALLVVVHFLRRPLASLLKGEPSGAWLYALAPTVLLLGLYQALYHWHNRCQHYRRMAGSRVLLSALTPAASIPLGRAGWNAWGLIAGQIAGQFASCLALIPGFFRRRGHPRPPSVPMRQMALRFRNFPAHNIASTLFNTLAHQLPLLLLGIFFDARIAGLYFLTYRVINLPMNLIGNSVWDVYYRRSLEIIEEPERMRRSMETAVAALLLLAALPFLGLLLFSGRLFALVFGAEWREAGLYTQVMLPFFLLRFLTSPLNLFIQKGLTLLLLKWQAMLFVTVTAGLAIGGLNRSPLLAVGLMSTAGSLCYAWLLHANLKLARASIPGVMKQAGALLRRPSQAGGFRGGAKP